MAKSARYQKPHKHHPLFLPTWAIVILLTVFPPIAWYYMWKHRHYHSWLAGGLFLYAVITLLYGLTLFFFKFDVLQRFYRLIGFKDGVTTEQVLISIPIVLSFTLLILAVYLMHQVKRRSKLLPSQLTLTMVIVVIYSLVIPMGYNLFNIQSNKIAKQLISHFLPGLKSSLIPNSNEIADWKTYTDPQKLYSFQYPPAWEIKEETRYDYYDSRIRLFPPIPPCPNKKNNPLLCPYVEIIFISVRDNPKQLSIKELEGRNDPEAGIVIKFHPITIDDIEGLRTSDKPGLFENDDVFITHNGKLYNITLVKTLGQVRIPNETFEQILSTFKFTNSVDSRE